MTIPEPTKSATFQVTPGQPTMIQVKGTDGNPYQIEANLAVIAVRPTETRDPKTGHAIFELDFQVSMRTSPLKEE